MDYGNLRKLEHDNITRFTLKGREMFAKVVSVYDGDTCDLAFYDEELGDDELEHDSDNESHNDSDNDSDNDSYSDKGMDSSDTDEVQPKFMRYKCRMAGYNAPELDEPNGELSRDYLAHLCTGGKPNASFNEAILTNKDLQAKLNESTELVFAEFGREGKYGRPVVTLYQATRSQIPGKKKRLPSINDIMREFVEKLG